MGKSTKWAEVTCEIHGRVDDKIHHTREFPQVVTNIGMTRKERREGGCHKCKEEARRYK